MTRQIVSVIGVVVFLTAAIAAAPDFESIGRTVVGELAARSFDKVVERFDQKMTAALPRERLEATWNAVIAKAGAFKSVVTVRVQPVAGQPAHVTDLTSTFEKANLVIRVAFNDEGKIVGLFFAPAPPPGAQSVTPP